jgi:catalase-peroxidase
MGGPVIGFCGGRVDWSNSDQALPLGPSVIQQKIMPCGPEQCPIGEVCTPCESKQLAAAGIGLIYVDPEGTPLGEFGGTAANIREIFARMGFDDRMTVAGIGGGHAFGK